MDEQLQRLLELYKPYAFEQADLVIQYLLDKLKELQELKLVAQTKEPTEDLDLPYII